MTRRTVEYPRKHAGHEARVCADGQRYCKTCADARVAERRHNVRVLTALNQSAAQIAIRLDVSSRTVQRDRARLRQMDEHHKAAA